MVLYAFKAIVLTLNKSLEFLYINIMAIGNQFQYIKQYRADIKQQIAVIKPNIKYYYYNFI